MARPRYDYAFARRPGWIASHVFVLSCVGLFVYLGLWQVQRLEGRRQANALIEARMDQAPVPFAEAVPPDASPDSTQDATFRRVTVAGVYRYDQEVLVRNRTNEGAPGYWVLTPIDPGSGPAVVVNRGWVPLPAGEADDHGSFAPPTGPVTVTGVVRDGEQREGLGVADPESGTLRVLSRVDLDRLGAQVPERLAPVWVQLTDQTPVQAGPLPLVVARPVLDDGPHLNYAGQWFIFATLTLIVYPLLLRRVARSKAAGPEADLSEPLDGEGDDHGDGGGGAGPDRDGRSPGTGVGRRGAASPSSAVSR